VNGLDWSVCGLLIMVDVHLLNVKMENGWYAREI
jgi:hypothetical protein